MLISLLLYPRKNLPDDQTTHKLISLLSDKREMLLVKVLSCYYILVLMKDSKQEAMEKQRQGQECFQESNFREAMIKFFEGKLLLPKLDMYAEEMKQFCWWLAECHLRNVHAGKVSFIKPTGSD